MDFKSRESTTHKKFFSSVSFIGLTKSHFWWKTDDFIVTILQEYNFSIALNFLKVKAFLKLYVENINF